MLKAINFCIGLFITGCSFMYNEYTLRECGNYHVWHNRNTIFIVGESREFVIKELGTSEKTSDEVHIIVGDSIDILRRFRIQPNLASEKWVNGQRYQVFRYQSELKAFFVREHIDVYVKDQIIADIRLYLLKK